MDRSEKIQKLLQVLQGAPKEILKVTKLTFIQGAPANKMFLIDGKIATFKDVFSLVNQQNVISEVVKYG